MQPLQLHTRKTLKRLQLLHQHLFMKTVGQELEEHITGNQLQVQMQDQEEQGQIHQLRQETISIQKLQVELLVIQQI